MSNHPNIPQPKLGLGDTNIDPDILTKEIDHDFFDDPPEATASINIEDCQKGAGINLALVPNDENEAKSNLPMAPAPMEISTSSLPFPLMRSSSMDAPSIDVLDDGMEMRLEKSALNKGYYYYDELHNESGRSSSNVTLHLEVEKENFCSLGGEPSSSSSAAVGAAAGTSASAAMLDDFYSIHQSNATSPNYPRPKQCYQLQQRRRSYGSIRKNGGRGEQFQPMNNNDCGLNGQFDDLSSSSSSSSSSDSSDLSDSSESELESLDSDDEEFVDMLEKYFDYIDQDTDCSDLTEVSPLSSLATSPLPNSYLAPGIPDIGLDGTVPVNNMSLTTDNLCVATSDLHIHEEMQASSGSNHDDKEDRESTSFDELIENDPFFAGCHSKIRNLPLIISTTETVIIPAAQRDESGNGINGDRNSTKIVWPNVAKDKKEAQMLDEDKFDCCQGCSNEGIKTEDEAMSEENEQLKKDDEVKDVTDSSGASSGTSNANTAQISPKEDACASSRSSSSGCWSSANASRKVSAHSSASASSSSASSSFGSHNGFCSRKKRPMKNFTFSSDQMRKIERENHILLRKIIDTHNRGTHLHRGKGGHVHGHGHNRSASASIVRMRQQRRIDHENAIMMRRLQNVKPSKEIGEVFGKPTKN